jgi:hypothetical protein
LNTFLLIPGPAIFQAVAESYSGILPNAFKHKSIIMSYIIPKMYLIIPIAKKETLKEI